MNKEKTVLFAIYKNNEHMGNERAMSEMDAIKSYIIASDFESLLNDVKFIKQYSASVAINGIHHYKIP
jgi:predicted RNA-binding protein